MYLFKPLNMGRYTQIFTTGPVVCMSRVMSASSAACWAEWNWQITHGLMLKRSLAASGFADKKADPLSAPLLSVQVAAPPAGPTGDVGLVGLVGVDAFLLWISCTCFGLETATDWERDTVTWQCDRVKERKETPVSIGEAMEGSGQWEITEQPVEKAKHCCDGCACDEVKHVCHIIVQTDDSAQARAQRDNRCGGNEDRGTLSKQVFPTKRVMAALPRPLVFLPGWFPPQRCAGSASQMCFYAEWTHGMNP